MKKKSFVRRIVDTLNQPWTWIAIGLLALTGNFMMGTIIQFLTHTYCPDCGKDFLDSLPAKNVA